MGRTLLCTRFSFLIAEYLPKPNFPDEEKASAMKAPSIQIPDTVFIEQVVVDDGQSYSINDRIQQYALNLHQVRIN